MKTETRQNKKEYLMKQVEDAIQSFNFETRLTLGWIANKTEISRWLLNTLDLTAKLDELNSQHYFPKIYLKTRYKRRKQKNI